MSFTVCCWTYRTGWYLIEDDLLTLARDAEQAHSTARNAVGVAVHHLDAARQVLAVLETRVPG
ncbi:hypothetical protein ACFVYC_14475 [Pseudarthrobacter sp. NPDC058329]|uniref:hypothetical protein n=1 Tax=Pseudarthrobacter sp. NPDC058329 TaxID=3346448 RepID=UPI0036DB5074